MSKQGRGGSGGSAPARVVGEAPDPRKLPDRCAPPQPAPSTPRAPASAPPPPPRAPSLALRFLAARASSAGGSASPHYPVRPPAASPGSGRRSPLFCGHGGRGQWEVSVPGLPGAYRSGPAECGAPGRGVPSWAGWRARGLCAPARPRSAPLASSVTMDISRLRRRDIPLHWGIAVVNCCLFFCSLRKGAHTQVSSHEILISR